jgi:tRNA-dihydrouridine synthase A
MNHRFCVAPMLDWTDRHDRYFLRQISHNALLYTEMMTTGALIHGNRKKFLAFNSAEHPLALQLGGSQPQEMAQCARLAEQAGYNEVNINVGCPSDRVQNGCFGASLMATPEIVAECVGEMVVATSLPVTVKHRIGIDDQDSYEDLERFVECVSAAGCNTFIVHARKAWLQGLSPKENRSVPPLDYARVYRLKKEHPDLEIIINGGVKTLDEAAEHLAYVDGVMMGREAYQNPYVLADVDARFFSCEQQRPSRDAILQSMLPYIENELGQGVRLNKITRHFMGLFHGQEGARAWRRTLSEMANRKGAGLEVLEAAWDCVR